jgi:O-antigen biosynthesis protein
MPIRLWLVHANGCARRTIRRSYLLVQSSTTKVLDRVAAWFRRRRLPDPLSIDPPAPSAVPVDWAALGDRDYVLICPDFPPVFDHHSGALRLLRIVELIGQLGWPMLFAAHVPLQELPGVLGNPEKRALYEDRLRQAGVAHVTYGLEQADAMVTELGPRIRYAFISFPLVARDMIPLLRARCPNVRLMYDMVDFHAVRLERQAELTGDEGLRAQAATYRDIEVSAARAADITIAISDDEKAAMLREVPDANIVVLPNIFAAMADSPVGLENREGVLFVGGFGHVPNGDAARWFVAEVWPLVRAEIPDCRLRIAGSNPGEEVLALASVPGVEVLGYVSDLLPLYAQTRISVAPLRFGAGAKGKVGESLAHGVPVVATMIGAEGMSLKDGEHVLVADTAADFAAQVLRLLQDDRLWLGLSGAGRSHVESHFSQASAKLVLAGLFPHLTEKAA